MSDTPFPVIARPFHEGETALQQHTGAFGTLSVAGPRVIRSFMPQQHSDFFAQLPWVVMGALDAQGQPWAEALVGPPGFMRAPHAQQLRVDALPRASSPLAAALVQGVPVGLLGIEPQTRRRNRLNGVVGAVDAQGFALEVSQSFGNCPKYIQAREPVHRQRAGAGAVSASVHDARGLDAPARRVIAAADTFFIATAHPKAAHSTDPAQGVDVSHRGGSPGFARVVGDNELVVPDFNGNHFFNTLGNIALNPRCGLLFVDFDRGDLLYLAARGHVDWDAAPPAQYPGALRLLHLQIESVRRVEAALPLSWGPAQPSPVLAPLGPWRG